MSKLVVIEGLDGAGLSTQASLLASWLSNRGKYVVLTKEPTNNIIGGMVKSHLTGNQDVSTRALRLMFAADVIHHTEKEIAPSLQQGRYVICDRYILSSLAYGMIDFNKDWLEYIHTGYIIPDITFYLKVPPRECINRLRRKGFGLKLFEQETHFRRIEQNFDILAAEFPRVHAIDGNKSIKDVHENITKILLEKMTEWEKA